MSTASSPDTEELVEQAGNGDATALQQLLVRHRGRLRKMVAVRLDRRIVARVDPSDVVLDGLAAAVVGSTARLGVPADPIARPETPPEPGKGLAKLAVTLVVAGSWGHRARFRRVTSQPAERPRYRKDSERGGHSALRRSLHTIPPARVGRFAQVESVETRYVPLFRRTAGMFRSRSRRSRIGAIT
jgi:hypothetical protein